MSKIVDTRMVDDLDGKSPADETVRFGLDGKAYVIDLAESHAEALRKSLAKYIEHGRPESQKRSRYRRPVNNRRRSADIRAWAKENGYEISERGRIPVGLKEAYDAAT